MDKGTIATSGCGPTSMAMVLSALTGQVIDPTVTAEWSASHGYRVSEGTSWAFFKAIGDEYGINTQDINTGSDSLVQALSSGHIVITSMVPGDFTQIGHFIVLTGLTDDGQIMVNDPNSVARSQMTWDPKRISQQTKHAWAFSYAQGTKAHPGGLATVGDEGFLRGLSVATPELIFHSNGTVDLAGINGPELRKLDRGDVVMNAHDTRRMLRGAGHDGTAIDGAPTYANGTDNIFGAVRSWFANKDASQNNNNNNTQKEEAPQGTKIDVPDGLGKYTTYMEWHMITAKSSKQYKLRSDAGENYNPEGFGIINGRNVVAMTPTFGGIGDYVDIYLTDGNVIHGIIGDAKNMSDPGCTEWGHNNGNVVVEWVVQKGWNKGNPSLHGAGVDYVVNLGNYWGNPTFSGGANGGFVGTSRTSQYTKWFNGVLEALKGQLGTFSTNTHTAKKGVVDMFASGGVTGQNLVLGGEEGPELVHLPDGTIKLMTHPTLADFPKGTEIINADDTAAILDVLDPERTKIQKFAEGTLDINNPQDRVIQALLDEVFKKGFPDSANKDENNLLKDAKEAYDWAKKMFDSLADEVTYKAFKNFKTDKLFGSDNSITEEGQAAIDKFSNSLDESAKVLFNEFIDKLQWYNGLMIDAMNQGKDLLTQDAKNLTEFLDLTGVSMTDYIKKMKEEAQLSDEEAFSAYSEYLYGYNQRKGVLDKLTNNFLTPTDTLIEGQQLHQSQMHEGAEYIRNDTNFQSLLEKVGQTMEGTENWYDETGAFSQQYLNDLEHAKEVLDDEEWLDFQYYTESISWY